MTFDFLHVIYLMLKAPFAFLVVYILLTAVNGKNYMFLRPLEVTMRYDGNVERFLSGFEIS